MKKIASLVLTGATALSVAAAPNAAALTAESASPRHLDRSHAYCDTKFTKEEKDKFVAHAREVLPTYSIAYDTQNPDFEFSFDTLSLAFGDSDPASTTFVHFLKHETSAEHQNQVNTNIKRDDALSRGETVDAIKVTNASSYIASELSDYLPNREIPRVAAKTGPGTVSDVIDFHKRFAQNATGYYQEFKDEGLKERAENHASLYAMAKLKFDNYEQWRKEYVKCVAILDPQVKVPAFGEEMNEAPMPEAPKSTEQAPKPEAPKSTEQAPRPEAPKSEAPKSTEQAPKPEAPKSTEQAPKPEAPKPGASSNKDVNIAGIVVPIVVVTALLGVLATVAPSIISMLPPQLRALLSR
ncbi:hypothetical protein [Corynebacterium sp.]|uniref:hypothetical protein n=1 Tax=Corynebacterium sp. TaxID=1720 RepID=UPI0026DB3B53|nr:hypothetical protein [Corynebacterium sp.]MDO5032120.1 hypothetical protein [Corynebacterium sp.]